MRTLNLPPFTAADVLTTCISGFQDLPLRTRMYSVAPTLVAKAANYDQNARTKTLNLVARVKQVGGVDKDELEDLYTKQMSATRGAARSIYDAIRAAPPNAKCPLCGIGTVTGLDHHLPKSKYPDLSVCPSNLVPACDFCNDAKKAKYPQTAGEQTIHPYYDDFTREQWIYAKVDMGGTPIMTYFVRAPVHWTKIDSERVQRHFDVVKLGQSYTSNANDELISLRDHLVNIAKRQGASGVQFFLDDERARHSGRVNSWQHAMYQTLACNQQFISGGYSSRAG